MKRRRVLCINPWIHDFAAYDLWCKPVGLLTIASWLRSAGVEVSFIDCLDRFHPRLVARKPRSWFAQQEESYFCGKFYKKQIDPPPGLAHIDRPYFQYGLTDDFFFDDLAAAGEPDLCMISSMMTFWYPAAIHTIRCVRKLYPNVPIVAGGIYPTLYYEHAQKTLPAEYVHCGAPDDRLAEFLKDQLDLPDNLPSFDPLIDPAFDLVHNRHSVSVMTSVGCPFSCTYCASKILQPVYRRLPVEIILDRFRKYVSLYQTKHVAFFDDALLYNAHGHIIPLLEQWLQESGQLSFHTPNGLHARFIDERLATLLFRAGFKTLRLSLETTNKDRQMSSGGKIFSSELARSIRYLYRAGFKPDQIHVYLLIGLPDQTKEEILADIHAVHDMGARVELANFTPIPHTPVWKELMRQQIITGDDPLLHNKAVFFLKGGAFDIITMRKLRKYVSELNHRLI